MEDLKKLMREKFEEKRKDFYYPQLPQPKLVEDIPNGNINMENLEIKVSEPFITNLRNEHGIEEKVSFDDVLEHEMTHFMKYPGSVLNILRMHKVARKETEDEGKASSLREAFTEIQTNTYQVKEKKNKNTIRMRSTVKPDEQDKFGNLVYGLYQEIWEEDLGIQLDEEQRKLIAQLKDIDYTSKKSEKYNLRKFVKILKDYNSENSGNQGQGNNPNRFSNNDIREGIRQFAQECDNSEEFEEIVKEVLGDESKPVQSSQTQKGSRAGADKSILTLAKNYYTALAENYQIPVRKKQLHKNGSLYPHTHESFNVGDSIHDLDHFSSPSILPGITKKWIRKEGEVSSDSESVPDSVLVIDNSGSMPDPNETISIPILGSTIVSNAYLDNDSRVAVYSFGGVDGFTPLNKDKERVHRAIRQYSGGGTTFNPKFLEYALNEEEEFDLSVVSDMEISNLDNFVETLLEIPKTHRVHLLYSENNSNVDKLRDRFGSYENVAIMPLIQKKDIDNITMGELRKSVR